MTACAGTFCAAGPALRRSKPSPDEFSILEEAGLLAGFTWDGVEQLRAPALKVIQYESRPSSRYTPRELVIAVFHVISKVNLYCSINIDREVFIALISVEPQTQA